MNTYQNTYKTYYLNKSGHRWILAKFSGRKLQKMQVRILPDDFTPFQDTPIIRTALYFESFGNFASVCYSYKGKKHSTLNYELIEMES